MGFLKPPLLLLLRIQFLKQQIANGCFNTAQTTFYHTHKNQIYTAALMPA